MAFAKISQFLFSLNIFKASSWHDFLAGLSGFIGRILYRLLICALGKVADVCQLIFKKLAGISPNGVKFQGLNEKTGETIIQGDIVQYIIQSDAVRNILWAMLILAVVILIIAVFVANIKTEFAKDGNNNKRKVIKLAFRGLANFVLVPVICLFGLFIGNAVLRAIDGATNPTGSQTTLSAQIFLAGGYNANRTRQSETKGAGSDSITYYENSFGEKLKSNGANFGVFIDDSSGTIRRTAADKIDMFFANGYRILVGTSEVWNANGKVTDFNSDNGDHVYSRMANAVNLKELGVWHDGAFGDDIDIKLTTEEGWYGVKVDKDGKIGFVLNADYAQYVVFSIYDVGLVYTYYDLRIGSFDYLISTICLIFCAYTLLIAALGLVKRMFYLSILFIISPGVCAIYPIDEGKALERWRTEFIKYVLSAYSVVIVLNLFLALLPTLLRIELFTNWSTDLAWLPIDCELANYLARLLIIIGGLTFFKDATKQLSSIIGAADANGEGADASGKFTKNIKRVASGAALGAGIAKSGLGLAGGLISGIDQSIHSKSGKNPDANSLAKAAALGVDGKAESKGTNSSIPSNAEAPNGAANSVPGSAGGSSNSMNNAGGSGEMTAAEKAAVKADKKAKEANEDYNNPFSSAENREILDRMHDDKHSKAFNAARFFTKDGFKMVHNANITRKVRGAIGGLFSSIGGIASGKGKVSDSFNWSQGSDNFQKGEDKRKKDWKEKQEKSAQARQHADEVADDRALHQSLHQGDREHLDQVMQKAQGSAGANSNGSFNNTDTSTSDSTDSLGKDLKGVESDVKELSEKVKKLENENEELKRDAYAKNNNRTHTNSKRKK